MPIYIEDPGPVPGSGDDERLAFKEWGEGSYRTRPTGPGLMRQEPCLVCHHPTGDCTLEDHQRLEEKTVNRARQTRVQGDPSGNDANSNLYVVPDDVIEVYHPPLGAPTHRKSKRLVARKGEVITKTEAVRLGLIPAEETVAPATPDLSAPKIGVEGQSLGLQ
jgi:hypothetical protein